MNTGKLQAGFGGGAGGEVRILIPKLRMFTLIEMLVVISIIAILAALMLPSLVSAHNSARQLQCVNNMSQITHGIYSYANDNSNFLPMQHMNFDVNTLWVNTVSPYTDTVAGSALWLCPGISIHHAYGDSGSQRNTMLIGQNISISKFKRPSQLILLIDAYNISVLSGSWFASPPWLGGNSRAHPRHFNGENTLFLDGHGARVDGGKVEINLDDMWGRYSL